MGRNAATSDLQIEMAPFLLILPLFVLLSPSQSYAKYSPTYATINTKETHARNVSYSFDKMQGLSVKDKQRLLDMHNYLRAFIATGKEDRGYNTDSQPQGANMQALAWDDVLADFSQNWVNKGTFSHSKMNYEDERFKHCNAAENMSGDMLLVEVDMYGEVRWWNYDSFSCEPGKQCGHYRNVVNGLWSYMGCGWKFPTLICNFVGIMTSAVEEGKARRLLEHEYAKGTPCSMCEQGFDYCMSDALCATKAMCDSDSKNKCRCLNDASTCAANGGTFDAANCRCKCPASRYGINCKHECKNTPGYDDCGDKCTATSLSEAYFCNKACSGCGKDVSNAYKYWYVDRPPKNRDNIKTRGFWPSPVVTPPTPATTCKNIVLDSACATIASRNYCVKSEYKRICGKTCDTCGFKESSDSSSGDSGAGKEEIIPELGQSSTDGFVPF